MQKKSYKIFYSISGLILLAVFFLHLLVSSEAHDLSLLKHVLLDLRSDSDELTFIFWYVRLPRSLAALLVGLALGAAGSLCQGLFRNALATPSLLGSTSIAAFLGMISFYLLPLSWALYLVPLSAAVGAFAGTVTLIYISRYFHDRMNSILLAGYAINALFASLSSLFLSLVLRERMSISAVFNWLMGAINTPSYWQLLPPYLIVVLTAGLCFRHLPKLDVLNLGFDIAKNLGIRTKSIQTWTILAISALVAASLAVAGPIAFVGLIAPHIARFYLGFSSRRLFLGSMLIGGILVVSSDFLARILLYPSEIEVGIILSFVGAPYFIYLLLRSNRPKHLVGSTT